MSKQEEKIYNQLMNNAPTVTTSAQTQAAAESLAQAEQSTQPQNYSGGADIKLEAAINKYLNSSGFKYNTASDEAYQQYVQQQKANAEMGKNQSVNITNQLANGYSPTYADTVASEVYNDYLNGVGDRVGMFKQLADSENSLRNSQLANAAEIYAKQADTAYNQYRDTVADNKNYLNYLYERYLAERQSDVENNSNMTSIYGIQLNSAQSNLENARSFENSRYLHSTQSADNKAQIAENEYENNQKLAYEQAKDKYEAEQAAAKVKQNASKEQEKENDRWSRQGGDKFIKAYNLESAGYDYQLNQVAVGYYKGYISLDEMRYIAKKLDMNTDDVAAYIDKVEKNNKQKESIYGKGYNNGYNT